MMCWASVGLEGVVDLSVNYLISSTAECCMKPAVVFIVQLLILLEPVYHRHSSLDFLCLQFAKLPVSQQALLCVDLSRWHWLVDVLLSCCLFVWLYICPSQVSASLPAANVCFSEWVCRSASFQFVGSQSFHSLCLLFYAA